MSPADRHRAEIDAIRDDILSAAGVTDPKVRAEVVAGGAPEGLAGYLDKVRHASYRVTNEDIAGLVRAGMSEDALFELTVAAAFGIAYARLNAARRAMRVTP